MSTTLRVSIVIPAFNHAAYLPDAVKSVLNQTYPETELLVVNDGSTDDTADILASLQRLYGTERLKVFHQDNAGQAKALERGWSLARGDVFGYLSADDLLEAAAVEEAVTALAQHPDAVATYSDYALIDPENCHIRSVSAPRYDYARMLCDVICLPGPGAFFTRAAYEETGPWNPVYRQMPDYDFWLRMGLVGSFIYIPKTLASFRVHEGSQTFSITTPERAHEAIQIVENVLADPRLPKFLNAQKNKARANARLVSAQLDLRAGRLGAGLRKIAVSLQLRPTLLIQPHFYRTLLNSGLNRLGHRLLRIGRRGFRQHRQN